jgi:hypothetical protein
MMFVRSLALCALIGLSSCGPNASGFVDVSVAAAESGEFAEMCQSARGSETYDIAVGRQTALRLTNDGACAFSLFLITGPDGMPPGRRSYFAASLVDRPRAGEVKFVTTESATWVEYTPVLGFVGTDRFAFRLLPGGGMFPVAVEVVPAQEKKPPLRPEPASTLVHFEVNRSELPPDARRSLDLLKPVLSDVRFAQWKIDVSGHTDATGAEGYNQRLSERRALAVRTYLVDILGVDVGRINTVGYGPSVPLFNNRPFDGLNRRVHLTFRRSAHTEARPRP